MPTKSPAYYLIGEIAQKILAASGEHTAYNKAHLERGKTVYCVLALEEIELLLLS